MDIPGAEGINVYADAKVEYTRQLTQYSLQAFTGYFLKLLEETKEAEKDPKKLLLAYQNLLKNIPEWNQEKVLKETTFLLKEIKCDYFEDLLSAVFVAHTKVLSAIRLTSKQKKLQITIPKVEHFLHHTMIECARILWSNVFLFSQSGTPIERQRNLRQIEQLIQDGILQSIRSMLPVKNILKEYLKEDDEDDEKIEEVKEDELKTDETSEELKFETPKVVSKSQVEIHSETQSETQSETHSETQSETKVETQSETESKKKDKSSPVLELPTVESEKQSPIQTLQEQTIEVDTEPSVKFSDVDTVFTYQSSEDDKISTDGDLDESDSEDESENGSYIEILDTKPEPMDDYEDLEKKEETIDFENLE